ncbi:MAG: alpha/beta fold hydrolase [Bdellovibrionota bacterium]
MIEKITPDTLLYLDLVRRGFRRRRMSVMGVRINYVESREPPRAGGKPVVVLLHGIGANLSHWHRLMVWIRKAGYPVMALDLPGHGWSSEYPGLLSPPALHKILAEFLARWGVGKSYVLIGNSLGGALAMRFALDHPHAARGLMAISPAVGFETSESWERFKDRLKLGTLAEAMTFVRRLYHRPPWYLPLVARFALQALNRGAVKQILEQTTLEDFQIQADSTHYRLPTLLIWGKSESLFEPANLASLRRSLPSSVVIEEPEGVGHCPQLDRPKWLLRRILAFCAALPEARV